MNKAERDKAMGDSDKGFEDGYYFHVVHMFCDFLTEAYYENDVAGRKWEHLMEVLKAKLPAEVYEELFDNHFCAGQQKAQARKLMSEIHKWVEEHPWGFNPEEKTEPTSQGGPDCAHRS